VRLLHAYRLFDEHKFDESLNLFIEMDTEPPPVIGLYPGLLPEELRKHIKYPIKVPQLGMLCASDTPALFLGKGKKCIAACI
jgi:hypothetical protein